VPCEKLGEEVCACVRLKDGAQISCEEIREFATGKSRTTRFSVT
jgi:hypothetical protein